MLDLPLAFLPSALVPADPMMHKAMVGAMLPAALVGVLAVVLLVLGRKTERPALLWTLGLLVVPAVGVATIWLQRFELAADATGRWRNIFAGLSGLALLWVAGVFASQGGAVRRWTSITLASAAAGALGWFIGERLLFETTDPPQSPLYPQLLAAYTTAAFAILMPLAHERLSALSLLGLVAVAMSSGIGMMFAGFESAMWLTVSFALPLAVVAVLVLPGHGLTRRKAAKAKKAPATVEDEAGEEIEIVSHTQFVANALLAGGLFVGVMLPMLFMLAWLNSYDKTQTFAWAMVVPALAIPGLWIGRLPPLGARWLGGLVTMLVLGIAAAGGFIWTASLTDLRPYGFEQLNELGIPTPKVEEPEPGSAADYGW